MKPFNLVIMMNFVFVAKVWVTCAPIHVCKNIVFAVKFMHGELFQFNFKGLHACIPYHANVAGVDLTATATTSHWLSTHLIG
jgi:hypothetical protein